MRDREQVIRKAPDGTSVSVVMDSVSYGQGRENEDVLQVSVRFLWCMESVLLGHVPREWLLEFHLELDLPFPRCRRVRRPVPAGNCGSDREMSQAYLVFRLSLDEFLALPPVASLPETWSVSILEACSNGAILRPAYQLALP